MWTRLCFVVSLDSLRGYRKGFDTSRERTPPRHVSRFMFDSKEETYSENTYIITMALDEGVT